jgi:hypothetical protein
MSLPVIEEIVAGAGFAIVGCALWFPLLRKGSARWRADRREHARAHQAFTAAIEASLDDTEFSPDLVLEAVDEIVRRASALWSGHRSMGPGRNDDQVIRGWASATVASWGPDLRVVSRPKVDFLRVVNRDGVDEDRIVLRVRLRYIVAVAFRSGTHIP